LSPPERVGYVLKVYPRFSETFVVQEILAHERAGADLEIFALRPTTDARFHADLARVKAPVTHLPAAGLKADGLWAALRGAAPLPGISALFDDPVAAEARDVDQAIALAHAVGHRGIGHLHAHFGTAATTVARLAARLAGIEYSFTAHAKDIFHAEVDQRSLQRKLLDARAVITVSDYNAEHLRAASPPAAGRIHRVYNGLELDCFPFVSPAERPPVVAAVGRLVEKKGFADLVDACAILRDAGARFACVIVGTGPLEAELRARIAERGLQGIVSLLGPRTQDEVRVLVQGAAAMAAPCVVGSDGNRDGLPTVLLEAMALGTPCVSTDVTGIPEVLRDGRTGLAVAQRDPAGLASALGRLLEDARLRLALARAARALIEESFDADRTAAAVRAAIGCSARADEVVAA